MMDDSSSASIDLRSRFFESCPDLLAVADFDGVIREVNESWSALGHKPKQLIGRPYKELVHADDRKAVAREVSELIADEPRPRVFECRVLDVAGGFRWIRWSAVSDSRNELYLGLGTDVTEDKEIADRMLLNAVAARHFEQRLRDATRTADRSAETSAAYLDRLRVELRTPLNSIIGFAELLRDDVDSVLTPQNLAYVDRIQRNGEQVLCLINEVIDANIEAAETGDLVTRSQTPVAPERPSDV